MHRCRYRALKLILALDNKPKEELREKVSTLKNCLFKVGMQNFFTEKNEEYLLGVEPENLMLDLKINDIPSTVYKAVYDLVCDYNPVLLTIFCNDSGVKAARDAVDKLGSRTKLLNITVLTSELYTDTESIVRERVILSLENGADGVVCSGHEASMIRDMWSDGLIVCPGISLDDGRSQPDQKRVMKPREAFIAGATHIVVGRAILNADDPQKLIDDINTGTI